MSTGKLCLNSSREAPAQILELQILPIYILVDGILYIRLSPDPRDISLFKSTITHK